MQVEAQVGMSCHTKGRVLSMHFGFRRTYEVEIGVPDVRGQYECCRWCQDDRDQPGSHTSNGPRKPPDKRL